MKCLDVQLDAAGELRQQLAISGRIGFEFGDDGDVAWRDRAEPHRQHGPGRAQRLEHSFVCFEVSALGP